MMKPRTLSIASIGFWGVIITAILFAFPGINREITFYDEGVYLVTAKALASGLGYVRESLPDSPPEALYPPLLPLSLGLIWHFFPNFPDNLVIMRILTLIVGVHFLAVSYRYLKDGLGLGDIEALSIVALVGLHPLFVDYTTRLTGEMPFALLSMASLYFYTRFASEDKLLHLGFAISFAALAVLTRTIGIALFGALVAHLLLMGRFRLSIAAAACGAVALLPWQLWTLAAQGGYSGYPMEIAINYRGYIVLLFLTDWIHQLPRSLLINLISIIINWAFFVLPWVPPIIGGLIVAVAISPFFRNFWPQPRIHDLYCVISLLLILIWPWPYNRRFLLVMSPFLISYFFGGIKFFISRGLTKPLLEETARKATTVVIAIVVSGAIVHNFIDARNYRGTAQRIIPVHTEFHRMLNWIKHNTPANSILVGDYDPAYHLFTGRKSIRLSFPDPFSIYYTDEVAREFPRAGRLLEWLKQRKACYLIDDPMIGGREYLYNRNLIQAMKRVSPSSLSSIYVGGNGSFMVYKFAGCPQW